MKKWVYSTLLLLLLIIMCSCGGNTYAGTWYDSSDPDGRVLELYEDGKFTYGDVIGNYYAEEGEILLEPTIAGYSSEVLSINTYDNETCFIDEDGEIYFGSYDSACSYKEEMDVAEKVQEENDFERAKRNFENYLPGTWIAEK